MRNCDIFAQLFSAKKGIKYSWKYDDDQKKPGINGYIRIHTDDSTYLRQKDKSKGGKQITLPFPKIYTHFIVLRKRHMT